MKDSRTLVRIIAIAAAVACSIVSGATAATCPFNIPVVTLAPQQMAGYSWGNVIRPMNDACVTAIAVDPTNAAVWYAGSGTGLYMTKDNGVTWTKPVNGIVGPLLIVPGNPRLIYAGVGNLLYLSRDDGKNWTVIHTFATTVRSLLVNGGTLFVGLAWNSHVQPSGVFTSNLGGGFMTFHPFGPGQTGLIVWTLSRDPISGAVYAGTEIFDHPQPYHPPFFRSTNGGLAWTNVAGTLPWHVVASAVRPNDGYVYALTESLGLYGSSNMGGNWQAPANSPGLGGSLLMHPVAAKRLYAGRQKFGTLAGGIFLSTNAGSSFQPIGLNGVTVAAIALNGTNTRIYAATYASGIYTSPVP